MGHISVELLCIICAVFLVVVNSLGIRLYHTKLKVNKEATTHKTDKALLKEIEEALKNDEFKMHLQFVVENKTRQIVAAEALSRWEKSTGETVSPFIFIEPMKESGLIVKLDYSMFEKVCNKLEQWKGTALESLSISCNFTRITISEMDFVSKIKQIADCYDFNRKQLILEITEDSLESNFEIAMNNITQIKEMGFGIALDDLGSGVTSLMSLCEYPIHIVKIDRALFLKANEEKGKKLVRGIIALAHDLNLQVVCEGVETEDQLCFISKTDCEYIQGWYYSKAMPESQAENFVRNYTKKLNLMSGGIL